MTRVVPPGSTVFFLDNTVLCNFAAIDRLDLLRSVLFECGRWTEAVAYEAHRSAAYLPPLAELGADGWLGEPVEVTDDADIRNIERIRMFVFGGSLREPTKHLGEAQTCYILKNWLEFAGSWWITDDQEALRYAKGQGLVTRETIDLMSIAVETGEISARAAFALMNGMRERNRHPRMPGSPDDFTRRRGAARTSRP